MSPLNEYNPMVVMQYRSVSDDLEEEARGLVSNMNTRQYSQLASHILEFFDEII